MLADVRAASSNLDAVWMYPYGLPDHRPISEGRGLVVRGLQGEIWVNREGHRFHDETRRGGASGTPALLAQAGATCWSIIDARIAARMTVADPRYRSGDVPDRAAIDELLDGSPWITTADDLSTLGDRAGIDGAVLRATVEQHNARCGTDAVDEFGRDLTQVLPLVAPPFRALQFFPLARKNLGGIRTDTATRVLDERGSVIEGLHAVGELAGMAGGSINGRAALEGTMFGPSLYSGLIAGRALS
jgi:predicted oxidoreductase